jgi:hypothetical protein
LRLCVRRWQEINKHPVLARRLHLNHPRQRHKRGHHGH